MRMSSTSAMVGRLNTFQSTVWICAHKVSIGSPPCRDECVYYHLLYNMLQAD